MLHVLPSQLHAANWLTVVKLPSSKVYHYRLFERLPNIPHPHQGGLFV